MNNNLKIILGIGGAVLVLGLGFFIFSRPSAPTPARETLTKAQSKTYLKYVSLNGAVSPTVSPTLALSPTAAATVTPVVVETTPTPEPSVSITPEPTEIILAQVSPTGSEVSSSSEAEITESSSIAQLPTTGIISGSIVMFLAAFSMLVFAFVL